MTPEQTANTGDFAADVSKRANVGKRFYTWATLGTFAGASFLVMAIWHILRRAAGEASTFNHVGWPLLISAIVIIGFACATEPKAQQTLRHQKAQKCLIAVANTLLVFFAVIGENAILIG
jgi:NADH:ubiquinone oxidoreductase subunit 5 (subunit L)/multisubunit Na+/H+ antiporter MnhA subunit